MVGHHLVARDGTTLLIRRAAAEDETALAHLYEHLSPESAYHRFLGFPSRQSPWHDEIGALGGTACTLVAEAGGGLVGVASYEAIPRGRDDAEVAFTIADRLQGRGIGHAECSKVWSETEARAAGVQRSMSRRNLAPQPADAGRVPRRRLRGDVDDTRRGGRGTNRSRLLRPRVRERHAKRAGGRRHGRNAPFLPAAGIAVIGASRSPAQVGGRDSSATSALGGFTGALWP